MVLIPAQLEELETNWVELGKQEETKEGGIDKAESLVLKSKRQEDEEFLSGSSKVEVFLRCWARPIPKRLRRVWQQCWVPLLGFMLRQDEVSHGKVRT